MMLKVNIYKPSGRTQQVSLLLLDRTQWNVCSQRVCFKGVALILGTGTKTLTKRLKGMLDMRKAHGACEVPTRAPVEKNMVDPFFDELYHSTGESLPEHYHMKNLIAGDPQIDFQILNNEFAWTPGASFLDTVTSTQGLRNLFQRLAKTFEGPKLQSPYLLVHEACIKAEFIEWSHNLDLYGQSASVISSVEFCWKQKFQVEAKASPYKCHCAWVGHLLVLLQ